MDTERQKKRNISGWLNLYKPYGLGAMQATSKARFIMRATKAGHTGTLDPLAEGVLPVAFGEATKLIPLVHEGLKTYLFTVRWGIQTTTDDTEGDTVATHDHRPFYNDITQAISQFTGFIEQVPPAFSAVKINGQRAYAVARKEGADAVTLAAKRIFIDTFSLCEQPDNDTAIFEVSCGSGTYVRSLARDLALFLGTVGHCTRIIRTKVGPFDIKDAILLDSLAGIPYESLPTILQPLMQGLDDIPVLAVTESEALRLRAGQMVRFLSRMDEGRLPPRPVMGPIVAVFADQPVAICNLDGVSLSPSRVLNV